MLKSFEEIFPEVQSRLTDLETQRVGLHAKAKQGGWITFATVIGAFLAAFGFFKAQQFPVAIISVFGGLIASGFVYYYLVSKPRSEFTTAFKMQVMRKIVMSISEGLNYSPEQFVPEAVYEHSELFKTGYDRFHGEDGIQGKLGETSILMSELHTEYETQSTDDKGNTSTQYHTIFRGLFLQADFHKNFKGKTFVKPDFAEKAFGFVGKALQKMTTFSGQLVTLEDPEFEKAFAVTSTDQVEARYILSTSMMRRMLNLKQRYKGNVHFSFVDSQMYIAIEMTENLFEPEFSKSVLDKTYLQTYYDQLVSCLSIIEDLGLNIRIWGK